MFLKVGLLLSRFSAQHRAAGQDWLDEFRSRNPGQQFNGQINLSRERRQKFEQLLLDIKPTDFADSPDLPKPVTESHYAGKGYSVSFLSTLV